MYVHDLEGLVQIDRPEDMLSRLRSVRKGSLKPEDIPAAVISGLAEGIEDWLTNARGKSQPTS
jgi:hypothetical protein